MTAQGMNIELQPLPKPNGIDGLLKQLPGVSDILFGAGVPIRFGGLRYWSDPEVSFLTLPSGRKALRFGSTGYEGSVAVDLEDGAVIEIANTPDADALMINSSLENFVKTVGVVSARYPYYDEGAESHEKRAVAREVRDIIREIDPDAVLSDHFWAAIVEDMEIGDFSTQDVDQF